MNNSVLVGNIVQDVELRKTTNGTSVLDFTLAVNEKIKGEQVVDYIEIECWGNTAENVAKYCGKGSKVGVVGKIKTSSYTAQDGRQIRKTYVRGEMVEFYSTKKGEDMPNKMANPKNPTFNGKVIEEDELPFI